MDTQRCAAVVAAAETKSMSGAAKQLGYTPSGIVRLVNALEADMGFPLLVRSPGGVSLTPEGEKLIPVFREILRYEERMNQTSARIRGLVEGTLVVGVQAGAVPEWLAALFAEYLKRCGEIDFRVMEKNKATLLKMLENHNVDCCLVYGKPEGKSWEPLAMREIVAWLPKASPLAGNEELLLAELKGQPIVSIGAVRESFPEGLLHQRGIDLEPRYSVYDCSSAYSLVEAGLGCCLSFPETTQLLRDGVVARRLSPRRYAEFGIAMLEGPSMAPATEEFVACAREFAQALPQVEMTE